MTTTHWGILGTGKILAKIVGGFRLAKGVELHAVASRELERAQATAKEFGIPVAHGSYDALLADPEIDVVLNALHNGLHCEWTVRALAAGKHVLCEKPLALNAGEVERMFAAAKKHRRLLMEAFMYRFHPQMAEAKRRVEAGEIGRLLYIRSAYMARGRERKNPRYRKECGGGALMDIGCYCVNFSRLMAGSEPTRIAAQAHWDEECGVDLTLTGAMEFGGTGLRACLGSVAQAGTPVPPVTAHFSCSLESEGVFGAEVVGTAGKLLIPNPWLPPGGAGEIIITRDGKAESFRFQTPDWVSPFAGEIEHFSECVLTGESPMISEQDSLGNARTMDALFKAAKG